MASNGLNSQIFRTQPALNATVRVNPLEFRHDLWHKKPDAGVTKKLEVNSTSSHFVTDLECDGRQRHRRTDRNAVKHIGACISSRAKMRAHL